MIVHAIGDRANRRREAFGEFQVADRPAPADADEQGFAAFGKVMIRK